MKFSKTDNWFETGVQQTISGAKRDDINIPT